LIAEVLEDLELVPPGGPQDPRELRKVLDALGEVGSLVARECAEAITSRVERDGMEVVRVLEPDKGGTLEFMVPWSISRSRRDPADVEEGENEAVLNYPDGIEFQMAHKGFEPGRGANVDKDVAAFISKALGVRLNPGEIDLDSLIREYKDDIEDWILDEASNWGDIRIGEIDELEDAVYDAVSVDHYEEDDAWNDDPSGYYSIQVYNTATISDAEVMFTYGASPVIDVFAAGWVGVGASLT
jgi:hypothetical protein